MKFGLYLDLRNADPVATPWPDLYQDALRLCEDAEHLGASSVWLSEHHRFDDGYLPQPLTMAAAIAARTTNMRLGTAVTLATLHHPVALAEQASIVDILSDGRLDLGIGAGYRRAEFELYGVEIDRPISELFAIGAELRRLLDTPVVTPPPVQHPLPIWFGCNGPAGTRRAGVAGAPLLSLRRDLAGDYLAGFEEGGHDPAQARMSGPVNVFLTDDPERDSPAVERAYEYLWATYDAAAVEGTGRPVPPPRSATDALARGLSAGLAGLLVTTPDDAARQLADHLAGLPVDTVFSWSMLPGVPVELRARHLELWCRQLPALMA